ncbi:MAG: HNH endonuclease [Clostridiales bacterium]|nr:HNH endonuclease [Clostridiales bacterium]
MKKLITQTELKELLSYDKHTGIFMWITNNPRYAKFKGTQAGAVGSKGYINIEIKGRTYKAHRLAWLYITGLHPTDEIDHKNRITNDNKFLNLRNTTGLVNTKNKTLYKNNKGGTNGVYPTRSGKYSAKIRVNKKLIALGVYAEKNDAIIARKNAEKLYGFNDNHGQKLVP